MIMQRTGYDCAVCSLAMFMGKTYEDIFLAFNKPSEGIPAGEVAEYLWKNGFPKISWFQCSRLPDWKSLVVVNSKNYSGKWHMIYFDGKNFFDPSSSSKYENIDDVESNLIGFLSEVQNE